jgi:hypothetical protein
MATPIAIPAVPAAARPDGYTFTTAAINKPAGYSRIYWEFDIPIAAEYENTANEIDMFLLVNGDPSESVWKGGRATNKQGTVDFSPPVQYDISQVPTGATLQIKFVVVKAMTVGIKNGVID